MFVLRELIDHVGLIIFGNLLCDVAEDQPEHAEEETDVDDEDDQLECFESIVYHHEKLDLVVVLVHVFCKFRVGLDQLSHPLLRKLLDTYKH